jgi:mono/diheme cytochrome c family protein
MGGYALSFNTAQLNRPGPDGTNQLVALRNAGYFTGAPVIQPNLLPAHPSLDDETASVESRVRSYLEVNCSQCHQPNGPSRSPWDARAATPLAGARIVGETAVHQIENGGVKIVDAGKLVTSILYRRVAEFGPLHMPPLGTFVTNSQAVALLTRWVTNDLPRRPSFSTWVNDHFPEEYESLSHAEMDPDGDGDSNLHEFLVGTNPMLASDRWKVRMQANASGAVSLTYRRSANRRFTVEISDGMVGPWTPLDVPENRPRQAAVESEVTVALPPGLGVRFFRVNVVEP